MNDNIKSSCWSKLVLSNGKQTSCSLPLPPTTGVAGEAGLSRRREQVKGEDKQDQAEGDAEDSHLGGWVTGGD